MQLWKGMMERLWWMSGINNLHWTGLTATFNMPFVESVSLLLPLFTEISVTFSKTPWVFSSKIINPARVWEDLKKNTEIMSFYSAKKKPLLTFGNSLQNTLWGIFYTANLRQPRSLLWSLFWYILSSPAGTGSPLRECHLQQKASKLPLWIPVNPLTVAHTQRCWTYS